MNEGFVVKEYFYVVQIYLGTDILGVFWDLKDAKRACEIEQAKQGYYVKFRESPKGIVDVTNFGTGIFYTITPYERNIMKTSVKEEDVTTP